MTQPARRQASHAGQARHAAGYAERLPAGHPVWLVIEAVRLLDTSAFHARRRTGRAGHLEGETLRERTG
jgi:hypothetical protein